MSDSEFFSAQEAAQRLGVQVRTLYLYIRQGKLEAQKTGKSFRIPKQEVFDFLLQNRTKGVLVVKVGTIRLKLDGVLIATEGGRVMTEAAKGIAQIEVCLGVLWPQMQGPQIAGDSFIHASQIGQCSTQIVVALRMRRCDLQDLLVVRRRLGKLPGPVAVVAPVEQLSRPGNCFG